MTSQRGGKLESLDEVELWRSIATSWKKLQRAAEKNLMRADLAIADYRILRALRERGPSPMNNLCQETTLSAPTITGIVDKLEEHGLVERVRSQEDRREVMIGITTKGTEVFRKAEEIHRRFVEKSLSALKREDVVKLVGLLERLADSSDSVTQ